MVGSCCIAELHPEPGSESIDHMFVSSTLVMRGEVKTVAVMRAVPGTWRGAQTLVTTYVAQVIPDKVYKGEPAPTIEVEYVRPDDRMCTVSTCIRLLVGEFDYFFLVGNGPTYELNDPYFGHFSASHLTHNASLSGIQGLKDDFVTGLDDSNEQVRLMQAELVGSSGRRADADVLKPLLNSGDELMVGTASYSLLRLGDYSALPSMQRFLESRPAIGGVDRLRFLCLWQINAINDDGAVGGLIELSKSPVDDVREAAVHALRSIGDPRAVSVFVHLLNDKVQMTRYDAVLGLAQIERNWKFAPAVDVFKADEGKYISAWKEWARQNGYSTNLP